MIQNQSAAVDFNTAAAQTVVTGVAGKRIVVYGYLLTNGVATAQSVQWRSGSTNLTGVMQMPLSIGATLSVQTGHDHVGVFQTNPGDNLVLNMTAATQVGGFVDFKYV